MSTSSADNVIKEACVCESVAKKASNCWSSVHDVKSSSHSHQLKVADSSNLVKLAQPTRQFTAAAGAK